MHVDANRKALEGLPLLLNPPNPRLEGYLRLTARMPPHVTQQTICCCCMCAAAAAVGVVAVEEGGETKLTMLLVGVVSKGVEEG